MSDKDCHDIDFILVMMLTAEGGCPTQRQITTT